MGKLLSEGGINQVKKGTKTLLITGSIFLVVYHVVLTSRYLDVFIKRVIANGSSLSSLRH